MTAKKELPYLDDEGVRKFIDTKRHWVNFSINHFIITGFSILAILCSISFALRFDKIDFAYVMEGTISGFFLGIYLKLFNQVGLKPKIIKLSHCAVLGAIGLILSFNAITFELIFDTTFFNTNLYMLSGTLGFALLGYVSTSLVFYKSNPLIEQYLKLSNNKSERDKSIYKGLIFYKDLEFTYNRPPRVVVQNDPAPPKFNAEEFIKEKVSEIKEEFKESDEIQKILNTQTADKKQISEPVDSTKFNPAVNERIAELNNKKHQILKQNREP